MMKILLTWLLILASTCFYALEGSDVFGPVAVDSVDPDLTLVSPCGGEIWTAGTIQDIQWVAFDNHFDANPIDISYSADGSLLTELFASIPNSGSIEWTIPYISSDTAMLQIRAKDQFGNTSRDFSSASFHIIEPKLRSPTELNISVTDDSDILLAWDAVTHYVDGHPVSPDGYIVLCSTFPSQDLTDYLVVGYCIGHYFIHENAVRTWPNGYYIVIASKNQSFGVPLSSLNRLEPSSVADTQTESQNWQIESKDGRK